MKTSGENGSVEPFVNDVTALPDDISGFLIESSSVTTGLTDIDNITISVALDDYLNARYPFTFFLQSVLSFVIIIANGIVIATLLKATYLRTVFYKITKHLAIADSMIGIAALLRQLLLTTIGISQKKPHYVCLVPIIIMTVGGFVSLTCTAMLSYERYLSLRPRQGSYHVNMKRLYRRIMMGSWGFWIFIAIAQLYAIEDEDTTNITHSETNSCLIGGDFLSPYYWRTVAIMGMVIVSVVILLQIKSYIRARRQVRVYSNVETNRHQLFMLSGNQNIIPAAHLPMEAIQHQSSTNESYELRLARGGKYLTQTSLTVVLLTGICWMPFLFNVIMNSWMPPEKRTGADISASLGFMVLVNAFVNIFIYAHQMHPFRRAMVSLLTCKTKPVMSIAAISDLPVSVRQVAPNNT